MMPFRLTRPTVLALAVALASVAPLPTARAQPASGVTAADEHVLEIRDGHLYHDGRRLPAENLPDDLDLTGIEMTYRFAGPVLPVLEIDGVVYVLEDEHLRVLAETDRAAAQVYFLGQPEPATAPAPPPPASGRLAGTDLSEAGEAAYLRQLSARDRSLYEQIGREQALENETFRLADRIRRTPDGAERDRMMRSLREKLEASFELKQEIRAAEIAQAEEQIEELRRLLRERGALREQIIERRMSELVGGGQ